VGLAASGPPGIGLHDWLGGIIVIAVHRPSIVAYAQGPIPPKVSFSGARPSDVGLQLQRRSTSHRGPFL
jgi:hypothetical protein